MNVKGQHWLILGLGLSGVAAARLLASKGARLTLWDGIDKAQFYESCSDFLKQDDIYMAGKELPADKYDGAILSPGIPRESEVARKAAGISSCLIGEVELASRWFDGKMIAVTGTNGKSTTTELIEAVLVEGGIHAKSCGNIGLPFSRVVHDGVSDVAVIEVSSFQLESIETFHPDIAIYLNLAADHLDRYPNLNAYGKAKERIFMNQDEQDVAIVQKELSISGIKAKQIEFSSHDQEADYTLKDGWVSRNGKRLLQQNTTALRGCHNAENIMAALGAAEAMGVDHSVADAAILKYRPLPHRLELVDVVDGVQFINDSKATNPDALLRALEGIEDPAVLIAGGKNKGFDFRPLAGVVGEKCKRVILIGESGEELQDAWGDWVSCETADSLERAVDTAFANRSGIKTVLLSPGCASFDMFKNFEERGERFKEAVSYLKKQQQGV